MEQTEFLIAVAGSRSGSSGSGRCIGSDSSSGEVDAIEPLIVNSSASLQGVHDSNSSSSSSSNSSFQLGNPPSLTAAASASSVSKPVSYQSVSSTEDTSTIAAVTAATKSTALGGNIPLIVFDNTDPEFDDHDPDDDLDL